MCRVTQGDVGFAGDHRRQIGFVGLGEGGVNLIGVVTVDFNNMPTGGLETGHLINGVGQGDRAIDGDVVIVPHHDQLAQLMTAGKGDGFLADAFH